MSRGRQRPTAGAVDRLPSGRWRVRIVDPTTRRRVSIGSYRTRSQAEAAFAAAVVDQARGGWVTPEDGRITLAEYAPRWLASRLTSGGESLRPRVRELHDAQLRLHILPVLGSVPLGRLKTAAVRRWHSELLTGGVGQSTAAKCYRLLRAILNTAVEDGHVVANPCSIKGAGVEHCEERRIPSIDEVYGIAGVVSPRFRALVLLAAFGGLRRGELFALTRVDVDLLHRTVNVRAQRQESKSGAALIGPPKTAAGWRVLALPAELVPVLDNHLDAWVAAAPGALVFVGDRGAPLRAGVWQREWDAARRSIGKPELHLHDLRHVAGTLAAATGAGTKEIMRRLGHATPQAALRYQHATDDRDRVLADGIDAVIRAARIETKADVVPIGTHPATPRCTLRGAYPA
jgi:integrase